MQQLHGRAQADQPGVGRGKYHPVLGDQPGAEQPDQPEAVARESRGRGVHNSLRPGQERHPAGDAEGGQ